MDGRLDNEAKENRNVIILGAGASYDAGIPLLRGFVDRMHDVRDGRRGLELARNPSSEDQRIIGSAIAAIQSLSSYHARANFDERNIEDVLSILSFRKIARDPDAGDRYAAVVAGIARTIELCCGIQPGVPAYVGKEPDALMHYVRFWRILFESFDDESDLPTIVTFNYDLVLERALVYALRKGIKYLHHNQIDAVSVKYCYSPFEDVTLPVQPDGEGARTYARHGSSDACEKTLDIELLKLHGSLNFYQTTDKSQDLKRLEECTEYPNIFPPVFNKMRGEASGLEEAWRIASSRLENARNVVIVGYSLPQTDVYMRYFLKASLGANKDLRQITVFDPVLFKQPSTQETQDMKDRFSRCFSENMRRHINFSPSHLDHSDPEPGTFGHFCWCINHAPKEIFF